ncbi:MATE family efflux transporter [Teredinibacter franksiae]|uniref:MATE family efflux transporter n=1 Tax=Teredinibacter franksiae TaxID=2761453 RepID=UPI0016238CE8|nr:MATE family efflux transporter [Teredinibacter franksiae]
MVQTFSTPLSSRTLWVSVLSLALPVAAQMILQSLIGMADVLMVGNLGPAALAAVGLAAKLHFLLLVLMAGLGAGCGILVAQYTGASNMPACQRTVALTLFVGAVVMIPFTLAFAFLSELWVPLINPDAEVARLTITYLKITAPVLLITQVIIIYEAGLRALGNTGLPLAMGALAGLCNIILNYALIFGHFGFPAMGVEGAAWATLVARALQLTGTLLWVYHKKHAFALAKSHFVAAANRQDLKRFVNFSLPLVINHIVWGVGNATYHVLTGYAGTDALAVMGIVVPIESLFFSIFIGLSNASTVLIGRALGGDKTDEAWQLYGFFIRLTMVLAAVLSVSLWFARPLVVGIFDELDVQTATLLNNTLAIFCVLVWIKTMNMVRILGVLRAGGDNRFCLTTDTLVMWGLGVPLYAFTIFSLDVSFLVIFALMFVEDTAKFLPVWVRIRFRRWMKNLTVAKA